MMAADRLLRVSEAADRLGVSPKTVYRLVNNRKLKVVPVGSGTSRPAIRVLESSVTALIRSAA